MASKQKSITSFFNKKTYSLSVETPAVNNDVTQFESTISGNIPFHFLLN
jgi:hypothetical protein